jgi:hypothetical protein
MSGWITTHWPHPDVDPDPIPWFIYLKAKRIVLPGDGDRVLFYEARECRIKMSEDSDRTKRVTHCIRKDRSGSHQLPLRQGAGGIVGLATVTGGPKDATSDGVRFDYGDGNPWKFKICSTEPLKLAKRIVPYAEMLSILQISQKKPATSFGLYHVKDDRHFAALLNAARLT